VATTGSTSFLSTADDEGPLIDAGPILLYDGTCGFCARSLQFVLQHEGPRKTLRFARLEGPLGTALRERHAELAGVDSLIWYEPRTAAAPERLLCRSRGGLRVARYLGGVWALLGSLGMIVPRVLMDAGYDWIARHRRQLAADACLVPTPGQRRRFLDV
jgi:predicted DCC family thiol-disulfide oxidoreductase YuxK